MQHHVVHEIDSSPPKLPGSASNKAVGSSQQLKPACVACCSCSPASMRVAVHVMLLAVMAALCGVCTAQTAQLLTLDGKPDSGTIGSSGANYYSFTVKDWGDVTLYLTVDGPNGV